MPSARSLIIDVAGRFKFSTLFRPSFPQLSLSSDPSWHRFFSLHIETGASQPFTLRLSKIPQPSPQFFTSPGYPGLYRSDPATECGRGLVVAQALEIAK